MFRSIRARLIASYVLLTLLTVGLVGTLALVLVQRRVQRQEVAQLRENAEAVARQAEDLIGPVPRLGDLQELAETAAFVGDVRVRIWDVERRLLADSGLAEIGDAVLWVLPSEVWRFDVQDQDVQPYLVMMPRMPHRSSLEGEPDLEEWTDQLEPESSYTLVRRWEGMSGHRFVFEPVPEGTPVSAFLSRAQGMRRSVDSVMVSIVGSSDLDERADLDGADPGGTADLERPRGYVEVSGGPDQSSAVLRTIGGAIWLAAGGTALLAVVLGLVVSQGLSAPVRALAATADQMGQGDLSVRAPVRGKGEIAHLAEQFNQMAGRLEASFREVASERDALRRFIADASHELRTPITALKSFVELLQGPAAGDPEAQAEFLAESQAQIERLEWLTRDLLDLSRLDGGLAVLDRAAHDAGDLIASVAAAFKARAREQGVALSLSPPQPALSVVCDRARIEMALSNLVDNALHYTPASGEVELGVRSDGARARLWVRDTGCGIAPQYQARIFERFARGTSGDGACPRPEGSGLGLAIVRSVAEAHGGRVWVESEVGKGSLFVIELPME